MQRILLIETASPRRVRKKGEEFSAGRMYGPADLTILCRDDPESVRELSTVAGARLIPLRSAQRDGILGGLRKENYDIVYAFWTGEMRYSRMKLAALRIPGRSRLVDIGDGHVFRLSVGTFLWFLRTRWKYRRPSDHAVFAVQKASQTLVGVQGEGARRAGDPELRAGEDILVLQSADPPAVLRALEMLREKPVFKEPRYTLFCRSHKEVLDQFRDHPMIHRVVAHTEMRNALGHVATLRRERFDAVVAFFTGDPSYWKIKFLAFLLVARHKLIFNENGDCFFFSWGAWSAHISRRMSTRLEPGAMPHWLVHLRGLAIVAVKLILFPFRFLWLLLVWLWLRSSELRSSG